MITRRIISVIFIAAFALQTFNKAFVILDYYNNTSSYAKNCINKAKPKLHCNGKCQMMKKMAEEEKKQQEKNNLKQHIENLTLSSKSFFGCHFLYKISVAKKKYPIIDDSKVIYRNYEIFHPPC